VATAQRRAAPPGPRPPADELGAFWSACAPVNRTLAGEDLDQAELWPHFYLADRGFPPLDLAPLDLVRIAPLRHDWPAWWPKGRARTFRLVVRAYEADGTFASLTARAVPEYNGGGVKVRDPKRKLAWPKLGRGVARGLLLADPGGVALLRGEAPADLESVWIVEGPTCLLRGALLAAAGRRRRAVLGAVYGSGFRALGKVKWPEGVQVYAATDEDGTGEGYAREIVRALRPRTVRRLSLATLKGETDGR